MPEYSRVCSAQNVAVYAASSPGTNQSLHTADKKLSGQAGRILALDPMVVRSVSLESVANMISTVPNYWVHMKEHTVVTRGGAAARAARYGPRGAWAPQPCGARAEEGTGGRLTVVG